MRSGDHFDGPIGGHPAGAFSSPYGEPSESLAIHHHHQQPDRRQSVSPTFPYPNLLQGQASPTAYGDPLPHSAPYADSLAHGSHSAHFGRTVAADVSFAADLAHTQHRQHHQQQHHQQQQHHHHHHHQHQHHVYRSHDVFRSAPTTPSPPRSEETAVIDSYAPQFDSRPPAATTSALPGASTAHVSPGSRQSSYIVSTGCKLKMQMCAESSRVCFVCACVIHIIFH